MGRLRSREWKDARSARLSSRSAGIGTSWPRASARTLTTGGSWLSCRSLRRRDRASENLSPVRIMFRKAMRVVWLGAAVTRTVSSSGVT